MSTNATRTAKTPEQLRAELKAWETSFANSNGRKPTREDIKKDQAIAAKYREYDNVRRRPTNPQTTPRKHARTTARKAEHNALQERPANAITATPSKTRRESKTLQPPEIAAIPEEEPTPAHVRCALGPTPQKDGAVLGIFDILSTGTPSKGETKKTDIAPEALVAGTPSKPSAPSSSAPNLSRTPQSSSTRRYLDAFGGTPLKRKREDGDRTPGTAKKLFATPSFLRRNWPLASVEEDANEPPAAGPPLKKRGLVRSLSTIIQGLKKQEEDRMDDEWDIMNELEAEERGDTTKPAAPPKILVEDSQAADMPLGPDKGIESSENESEVDAGALDANGNPRKVWKKKGLKRQTRRVIMRPVLQKVKTAPSALAAGEDGLVEETQMPEAPPGRSMQGDQENDEAFVDDEDGNEDETRDDSQQSLHAKGKKKKVPKVAKEKESDEGKEKKTKKVKPDAHANYRALKIKNKNSKGKGRGGRFGRR